MPDDTQGPARQSASLALRLRAAREASGLTQAQAAAELGVSRPLLIAIEKGTRDASLHELAPAGLRLPDEPEQLLRSFTPASSDRRALPRGDVRGPA